MSSGTLRQFPQLEQFVHGSCNDESSSVETSIYQDVIQSKLAVASITSMLTFFVLLYYRPPFICTQTTNVLAEEDKESHVIIYNVLFTWVFIVFIVVFFGKEIGSAVDGCLKDKDAVY